MPVDPQYLPETLLLIAATFAGVAAIRSLIAGRRPGALRAAGAGLACLLAAFALASTTRVATTTPALVPAAQSPGGARKSGPMTLVLGGVLLQVAPADHLVLSAEGTPFLKLDLHRSDLRVTCTVESEQGSAAKVVDNTIPVRAGLMDTRRDPHTLLVQSGGRRVLWVHYASPRRIEIVGDFYERRKEDDAQLSVHLISFRNGIEWAGGRMAEGTNLDLRNRGPGRIDFGAGGEVRVAAGE